jgi:hypothetical protein
MKTAVRAEQVEVDQAVRIGFEDELAGVSALGYVVWGIGGDHSCETGHENVECG